MLCLQNVSNIYRKPAFNTIHNCKQLLKPPSKPGDEEEKVPFIHPLSVSACGVVLFGRVNLSLWVYAGCLCVCMRAVCLCLCMLAHQRVDSVVYRLSTLWMA